MKRIFYILTIVSLFTTTGIHAQWLWSKSIGGTATEYFSRNCTDNSSNIYLAGNYTSNPCNFLTTSLSCNGVSDFFLAKYDANGNEQWVKQFGGFNSPGESEGVGEVVFDSNNNFIYMTGNFTGISNFVSITLQSFDSSDIFIAKFDLNGNCIWAKKAWGTGDGYANSIAIDNNGNIFIGGTNNDSTHFDTITISSGTFLAKYDATGNCIWAKSRFFNSSTLASTASFSSLKIYNSDIYSVGICFSDTIVIDTITVNNSNRNFISRFDNNGNVYWFKTFSSPTGSGSSPGLTMDGSGNFYTATSFNTTAVFGNDTLHSTSLSDFALAKYDSNGNYSWSLQGNSSQNAGTGKSQIAMSNDGGIFILGTFTGSINIGSYNITSGGLADIFLARYDANGIGLGVRQVSNANTFSISVDNSNQICISGSLWASATFGNNPTLTSQGFNNIYLAKSDVFTGIRGEGRIANNQLIIYANPTIGKCNITVPDDFLNEKNLTLSIYDNTGKLIQQKNLEMNDGKIQLNLEGETKGTYNVTLSNRIKNYNGKIIFE